MKKIIVFVFLGALFIACKIAPENINFGQDACHFCKMTIVDKPFAAELVTSKGKVYKYDAIECLVNNQLADNFEVAHYLVYDFHNQDNFIEATQAFYVISDQIKSPMSENLAAFNSMEYAQEFIDTNSGKLLNWEELFVYFKK